MDSQSSEAPVSSNIRLYLAKASVLSLLVAPGVSPEASDNENNHKVNLAVRPERFRRLRHIHRIKREYLDVSCLKFLEKHIPATPVEIAGENPNVIDFPKLPCAGFQTDKYLPRSLRHLDGFQVSWFEDIILETVRAVLCLMPGYRSLVASYAFLSNDALRDDDSETFRYFKWERSSESETPSKSLEMGAPVKYILAFQLPWVLGPRDIEHFVDKRLKSIPSYEDCVEDGQKRYNSAHKLWAKLWDVCRLHDCHWFVLTNYNQWVFGGFTKGWENGYSFGVVDAYGRDKPKPGPDGTSVLQRTPKLLEYLVYWTLSSMGVPDGLYIPPVPEETPIEMAVDDSLDDNLPPHLLPGHPNFRANRARSRPIEPSEFDGSAANTEVPSSAGVRFGSESDYDLILPPPLTRTRRPLVNPIPVNKHTINWLLTTRRTSKADVSPLLRAPSPVRSEWSDQSRATVQPFRHQGFINIDTIIVEEVFEYDTSEMDSS